MNKNKNKKQNFFCSGLNNVFKDVLICKCIKKKQRGNIIIWQKWRWNDYSGATAIFPYCVIFIWICVCRGQCVAVCLVHGKRNSCGYAGKCFLTVCCHVEGGLPCFAVVQCPLYDQGTGTRTLQRKIPSKIKQSSIHSTKSFWVKSYGCIEHSLS